MNSLEIQMYLKEKVKLCNIFRIKKAKIYQTAEIVA